MALCGRTVEKCRSASAISRPVNVAEPLADLRWSSFDVVVVGAEGAGMVAALLDAVRRAGKRAEFDWSRSALAYPCEQHQKCVSVNTGYLYF
jgi:hypothetical protein